MPKYRILDLDNCISDDGWRIPKIDWTQSDFNRRYHVYHMLAPFDLLANGQLLATPARLIVLTARPVSYRPMTEEWLRRNLVNAEYLVMRNDNEHAPSGVLKELQLGWLLAHYGIGRDDILDAYDDREDVIEMYLRNGIDGKLARAHDLCAYTQVGYKPRDDAMAGSGVARDLSASIDVAKKASAACSKVIA
jgi:hypothetical protein